MVATLETEKGISYFVEDKKSTAPWDLLEVDSPWMFESPGYIKSGLKYKDKIDAALGYTHYVKKGKLFRK